MDHSAHMGHDMGGMDHGSMSMSPTVTSTGAAASSTTATAMAGMAGMDHGGHGGHDMGGCKIEMTWNWHTIDACFLSKNWRVRNKADFAGICMGVFFLVILFEIIRRFTREYDRHLIRKAAKHNAMTSADSTASETGGPSMMSWMNPTPKDVFRPTIVQQLIRCAGYMVQFGLGYLIMLLAMYYNGYIIICILLGAFVGHFAAGWDDFAAGRSTGCH
ncbi:Ctr copper transporter family-domain-containing protein [Pyronema domesticum]|uniref:Copper transport protein n=1 Tax=Pyronema omphalodes (strain CBS 100304) TaxID=1076935 RepID=U4L3U4_PYROM|nr:Ctr copper transporter family-domain-containing protein [Pyronema domesticum]CCX11445.1 Similar to Copper transport protein ctr4; acc. no. O94722 [Pyronema omphalodes CBS 100304]